MKRPKYGYYVAFLRDTSPDTPWNTFNRHPAVFQKISDGKALIPGGRWVLDEWAPLLETERATRLRVWRHFSSPEGVLIASIFNLNHPQARYNGYLEEWKGLPPVYYGELEKLKISSLAANMLVMNGITTIADLRTKTYRDLRKLKNCGPASAAEIAAGLEALGFFLKREVEP